jgi:signal transduction histidine kinase
VILLAALLIVLKIGTIPLWVSACAIGLAYAKGPLTRWVERTLMGHHESAEQQEERIGNAIRALTRLNEFGLRISEILANEVDAEWADIGAAARAGADHRFEIAGSGLSLCVGPRVGGRRYMSRELRVLRSASLQLAAHHHQLNQHELRELTARAQMRALQAQINPHFLFNTLNVLANLIHSNPEKAERLTEELADIFRYALESTRVDSVSLDDELRFLESYLEIEKARFEERLSYSFDVDVQLRSMRILPMILQPLVENAVRHGIAPKVEGGEVRISAQMGDDHVVIVVEDTGMGYQSVSKHRGAGIGLTNVRERLQHLYGDTGTLKLETRRSGGTRAVLSLPQFAGVHS